MIREFTSLAEIESVPGYAARLYDGKHALSKPLGWYRFKKKIHCALKSCNQPHGHGFVVMTASGIVIAVGNICGADVFGQDFVNATAAISKEIARQIQLREIVEQSESLTTFRNRADRLLKGFRLAEWLERAEQSLRRVCPPRVLGALYDRAANRNPTIEFTRERTKDDPPALMGSEPKTHHRGSWDSPWTRGTARAIGSGHFGSAYTFTPNDVLDTDRRIFD